MCYVCKEQRNKKAKAGTIIDSLFADVPPLEDMSEELERAKARVKTTYSQEKSREVPIAKSTTPQPIPVAQNSTVVTASSTAAAKDKAKTPSSTFGGFKKGFLFSQPSKTNKTKKTNSNKSSETGIQKPLSSSQSSSESEQKSKGGSTLSNIVDDNIPFVKPKSGEAARGSGLEIPEVQSAMKESYPFLNTNDWVTDDLLSKIEKHPVLSKVFQDPQLSQLVTEFQKNPQAALEAAKGNAQMQNFLQEFCSLMGDHFTQLADKETASNSAASNAPLISEVSSSVSPSSEDDEQMKRMLAKPDVQRALQDPEIQRLIVALKTKPKDAQRMFRSGNGDFQHKVKILIDNGLLAMQHF